MILKGLYDTATDHKKIKLSKELKRYLKNDINALYGLCVTTIYEDTDSVKERSIANESNN